MITIDSILIRLVCNFWKEVQISMSIFKWLYRALLTTNSIILLIIVYCVKERLWLPRLEIYTVILYGIVPICLAALCIKLRCFLSSDSIVGDIQSIELANDVYLPSYLGYFFVALSIPNKDTITLCFVFTVLFVFIFCSQALYYNPLFLIMGYKFYYVINSKNMKIFIISKREIRIVDVVTFRNLKRINDYTFIDEEKDK